MFFVATALASSALQPVHELGVRGLQHRGLLVAAVHGDVVATGGADGRVRLWRPDGSTRTLRGHGDAVHALAFSPDGSLLVTGSADRSLQLWEVATGDHAGRKLEAHRGAVFGLDWTGSRIASSGSDGVVRVWTAKELRRGSLPGRFVEPLLEIRAHRDTATDVAVAADGRLATTGADGLLRIWSDEGYLLRHIAAPHGGRVDAVAWSKDGQLATAGQDGIVRLRNGRTGVTEDELAGHGANVVDLAFAEDGRLATASRDGIVRVWQNARMVLELHGHADVVGSVSWDGTDLLTAGWDGAVRRWTSDGTASNADITTELTAIAWSPDGCCLATAGRDRLVRLWNRERSTLLATLSGHAREVMDVAWSVDGSRLATVSLDGTLRVWTPDGVPVGKPVSLGRELSAVVWTKNNHLIAGGFSPRAWIIAPDGTLAGALEGHEDWVLSLARNSDGSLLATGSTDQQVRLWDGETFAPKRAIVTKDGGVTALAFSEDDTLLAVGSWRNGVRLFRPQTGKELKRLQVVGGQVRALGFDAKRNHLAVAPQEGPARVYDVTTGREKSFVTGHDGPTRDVAFAPGTDELATAGSDGMVLLYSFD